MGFPVLALIFATLKFQPPPRLSFFLSWTFVNQDGNPLQCGSAESCTCLGNLYKNNTMIYCEPCPNGAAPIRIATFEVPNGCGGCLPDQFNRSGQCVPATDCEPETFITVNLTATADRSCSPCRPQHFSTQVRTCQG